MFKKLLLIASTIGPAALASPSEVLSCDYSSSRDHTFHRPMTVTSERQNIRGVLIRHYTQVIGPIQLLVATDLNLADTFISISSIDGANPGQMLSSTSTSRIPLTGVPNSIELSLNVDNDVYIITCKTK